MEMLDLFFSSGRLSSPCKSEKAFQNERSNSEQESFACHVTWKVVQFILKVLIL